MKTGAFGVKDSIGSYSENYGPHKIGGFAFFIVTGRIKIFLFLNNASSEIKFSGLSGFQSLQSAFYFLETRILTCFRYVA